MHISSQNCFKLVLATFDERMKKLYRTLFRVCPTLSLMFSLVVILATSSINNGISPVYVVLCAQVYLNWFSIHRISQKATTIISKRRMDIDRSTIEANDRSTNNVLRDPITNSKFWYCEKCEHYTCTYAHHCTLCDKCFHYRDHHCFFLGGCILRHNMGNFILICFYTSLASIYSLSVLGPYLYEHLHHFINPDSSVVSIILNFSFPVALTRLLFSDEDTCIVLVTLFDALFSISCICFAYGVWKLYVCLTGKQRYLPHVARKQDLMEIFGSYGLYNFIFPYNGLLGSRDLNGQYELKEV